MGIVFDPEEARQSWCICFKLDPDKPDVPENLLCTTRGVMGYLTDEQEKEFCPVKRILPLGIPAREWIGKIKVANEIIERHLPKPEKEFWGSVRKEAELRERA